MKIWDDEEVKQLFNEVEKCKKENRSLRDAFCLHAKKFGRKTNSVRNYYYADVDNLGRDNLRAQRLGINLEVHEKKHFSAFDKTQEEELFEKIKELESSGMSVRSACQKLSNGDLTIMTRLQNKYQNMQRKLRPADNVIVFKQKLLTDSEINSLFLGLVRLIKRSAQEEAGASKKASSEFNKKQKKLELLEKQLSELGSLNEKLKNQIKALENENSTLKFKLSVINSKTDEQTKNKQFEQEISKIRLENKKEQSKRV